MRPAIAFGCLVVPWVSKPPNAVQDVGRLEGVQQNSECGRPPPRDFEVGASILLRADASRRCRVELVRTGLVLRSDLRGSIPDPGRSVVIDNRGRVYTDQLGNRGTIVLWDSTGRFEGVFGRSGEGPREFSTQGAFALFLDGMDNLHVLSGLGQWSVVSPTLEWISRTERMPPVVMHGPLRPLVMPRGEIVTSPGNMREDVRQAFAVVSSDGQMIGSFGASRSDGDSPYSHARRLMVVADEMHFWAGPEGAPSRYVLELWGLDGRRDLVLTRRAAWFPAEEAKARGVKADELVPVDPNRVRQAPHPTMWHLAADTTGLLVTYTRVPTERWAEIIGTWQDPSRRPDLSGAYSAYMEVIDAQSGVVLASRHFESWHAVTGFVPGRMMAYRQEEAQDGLLELHLFDIRLVGEK